MKTRFSLRSQEDLELWDAIREVIGLKPFTNEPRRPRHTDGPGLPVHPGPFYAQATRRPVTT